MACIMMGAMLVNRGENFLVDALYDCFFFFFQAEDGIRDLTVTGVQTCALPIWAGPAVRAHQRHARRRAGRAGDLHGLAPLALTGAHCGTGSPLGTAAGTRALKSRADGSVNDFRNATRSAISASLRWSGVCNRESSVLITESVVAASPWYVERSAGSSCEASYVVSVSGTSL